MVGNVHRIHPEASGDHRIRVTASAAHEHDGLFDPLLDPSLDTAWADVGFSPEETEQWTAAGVSSPDTALVMVAAGLEPDDGQRTWRTFPSTVGAPADQDSGREQSEPPERLTIAEALDVGVISYPGIYVVRDWMRACDELHAAEASGDELRRRRAARTVADAEAQLKVLDLIPPAFDRLGRMDL